MAPPPRVTPGPSPKTPAPGADQDQGPGLVLPPLTVRNVQAPVTVLDAEGQIVHGLNALDFKLYDNGREQNIFEDLSEHPISLVVAIQANRACDPLRIFARRPVCSTIWWPATTMGKLP